LAAMEVALALPLLAGAGLFLATLRNLSGVETGFLRENVLQARISVDRANLPRDRWSGAYEQLVEGARVIPGVRWVSIVNHGLITEDTTSSGPVHFEGYRRRGDEPRNLPETQAGPEYFAAAGIPLRMGRLLTAEDAGRKPEVAVVNEALARQYFAGRNPIG